MSELLNKFNSIEILRFFLHGLFIVFPISIFPNIIDNIGLIGFTLLIIFSGILLYSIPIDEYIPSYKQQYIEEINELIKKICNEPSLENPRELYDVYFYNELSENMRYRIHFYVSLYYLYSRAFLSTSIYSIFFITILIFFKKIPILIYLFELHPFPYKLITILILCLLSAYFTYREATKIIHKISDLEIVNIKCNSEKILLLVEKMYSNKS